MVPHWFSNPNTRTKRSDRILKATPMEGSPMTAEQRATCIYCSTEIDPSRGAGDHVIPAALGRFRDDLRFRRICRDCNTKLGALEEVLLRSAPEALFRRFVPAGRGKRGSAWVAAKGGARPLTTRDHDDHTELIELCPENPENALPIDQLVVRDTKGVEHHLSLFPDMTAASLRRKIADAAPAPNSPMSLHAEDPNHDVYVGLLAELYPDSPYIEGESVDEGVHRVRGQTVFHFSTDYFRALAKIAFHYYLVVNQRGFCGDEPEFTDIRCFIMEGGELEEFFCGGGSQFVSPYREIPGGGALLPAVWGHALAVDEEEREAVVNVMLLAGPKRLAPSHHIRVARFNSPIIVPRAQSAHVYIYYSELDEKGYSGFVSESPVYRVR
jgi:HNH endonuclease